MVVTAFGAVMGSFAIAIGTGDIAFDTFTVGEFFTSWAGCTLIGVWSGTFVASGVAFVALEADSGVCEETWEALAFTVVNNSVVNTFVASETFS